MFPASIHACSDCGHSTRRRNFQGQHPGQCRKLGNAQKLELLTLRAPLQSDFPEADVHERRQRVVTSRWPAVPSPRAPSGHLETFEIPKWQLLSGRFSCRSPLAVQYSDEWFVRPLLASTVDEE